MSYEIDSPYHRSEICRTGVQRGSVCDRGGIGCPIYHGPHVLAEDLKRKFDYAVSTLEAIVDNRVRGAEKELALACLRGLGLR